MSETLEQIDTEQTFQKLVINYRRNFQDFLARADKQYYDAIRTIVILSGVCFMMYLWRGKFMGDYFWVPILFWNIAMISGLLAFFYSAHNSFKNALKYEQQIRSLDMGLKYEDPKKIAELWAEESTHSIARGFFIRDNIIIGMISLVSFIIAIVVALVQILSM
ncbi:hypothetical protein IID04_05400 [PVC group bacterium]|nr:hypothetical protein [PVC group bacterium]